MKDQLALPADVLANVQRRWPDLADVWAAKVHEEFQTLCERYQATPRSILPARYGFVAAVDTPDGPLVLRSSPDPRGRDQAAVAVALADLGASPQIHEVVTADHGTWTVADRVLPGTPLSQTDPASVNPQALFAPLAMMRAQPAPLPDMPSVFDWLRDRLKDDHLTDLRPGTVVAPASERNMALTLLDGLACDHTPALCHGDASSGNIIAADLGRWKFIDPRGISGEHAYDVAVLAIRIQAVRKSVDVFAQISDLGQVMPDRLEAWMSIALAARV
ncbi:aminoglycoside phosphotransferase family protein [Actinoplanes sp. HUAS TT8]|uniref:aminoglycoside phosphotransferase family protein n=1 Tax=Actinoplanes sp. HUAS TT8 TaxID=3447453 RepID=UPI003F51C28D